MKLKGATAALMAGIVLSCMPLLSQTSQTQRQKIAAHTRSAQEHLKANRPDLAIAEFSAIIALDPKDADAHGNLGVLYFFQSDFPNAARELRSALKLRPGLWRIQALLGMAEKRIGQGAKARQDLEQSWPHLDDEKIRVQAGMELIELCYASRDLDKAASVVAVLRQLRPTDPDILYISYRIHSDLAGESMLSMALSAPNSARMHQVMAHELARQGNSADAITHYREALKLDPKLPGAQFDLAEMLRGATDTAVQDQAEESYRNALAINPYDGKSECRLGDIATRRGDLKKAQEHYARAVELQPSDPEANLGLGRTLMAMNEPQRARPMLERAVKLDPTSSLAHYRLAALYRQLGDSEGAQRELAAFQRFKEMKEKLRQVYEAMSLNPVNQDRPEPEVTK